MQVNLRRRISYSVNSDNQLLVRCGTTSSVAKGRFAIDGQNRLAYVLEEPEHWRREWGLPGTVTFIGNWKLDANHDLALKVHEAPSSGGKEQLTLGSRIIAVSGNTVAFEVKSRDSAGLLHLSILTLSGTWKADESSRLVFTVKKKQPDTLLLEAGWFLDREQHLTYRYERRELKTKRTSMQEITFLGHWVMTGTRRLAYELTGSSDSRFEFLAYLETPNLYPQRGVMKYRIGAGTHKRNPGSPATLLLYGTWKFSRAWGARFEIDYGSHGREALCAAIEKTIARTGQVVFELTSERGVSLGVSATYTPRFLGKKDALVWGRLRHSRSESRIEAGGRVAF